MPQVNFIMICIIHKISVLLKITRTSKCIIYFYFFKKRFFSQHIIIESPKPDKLNIVKDVRNLFRLNEIKNETNDAGIKVIRSLFRLEKKI